MRMDIRKYIPAALSIVCGLCLAIGVYLADRSDIGMASTTDIMDVRFTDVSSGKTGANGITSNNRYAVDDVWGNSLVSENGVVRPGDFFDLSYKLSNHSNRSMDVRQKVVLTSSLPMSGKECTLTITGENYNTTAIPGTLSEDGLTLTYDLEEIVLNGIGEKAEKETDVHWFGQRYTVRLDLDIKEGSAIQDADMTVKVDVQARLHRDSDDSMWSDLGEYAVNFRLQGEETGNVRDRYEKIEGHVINHLGNITSTSLSACYTRIPVQEGEQWFIWFENTQSYAASSWGAVRFEDSSQTKVGTADLSAQPQYNLNPDSNVPGVFLTVPEGAYYMCLNLKVETTGEYGSLRDYTNSAIIARSDMDFDHSLVVFGDSITEINYTCDKNWVIQAIDSLSSVYYNLARSGRGYFCNGGYSSFFYRLPENESAVDLIVLYGSFNDLTSEYDGISHEIGTASDVYVEGEINSLAAYMNFTYDYLQTKYPNTEIAVIAPAPWSMHDPDDPQNRASQYVDVMKEICKRRGFSFLDLYHESGMTPWLEEYNEQYYYNGDGTHPNDEGQKILAEKIIPFLQELLNN